MSDIKISNLRFKYPGERRWALRTTSLEIDSGEWVFVYGPSGHGKSTFLKSLVGLVPHATGGLFGGRVHVGQRDTRDGIAVPPCTYMWQDPEVQCLMSKVWAEVAFSAYNIHGDEFDVTENVRKACRMVDIEHLIHRDIDSLSGGELQRTVLASILNTRCDVLVLDEPTSQLDLDGKSAFYKALQTNETPTVVIAEHDVPYWCRRADRILEVRNGRVTIREKKDALLYYSRNLKSIPKIEVDNAPSIVIRDLDFSYGNRIVFDSMNVTLNGGLCIVEGPNGSGKSTLAKLIADELKPKNGMIKSGRTALLLQHSRYYFTSKRVIDDLVLQARIYKKSRNYLNEIIQIMDIEKIIYKDPNAISVGERVRSAIALLLISDPEILILDEPTRGMDVEHKRKLLKYLSNLSSKGKTVIIMTNDSTIKKLVPFAYAYRITDGEVVRI